MNWKTFSKRHSIYGYNHNELWQCNICKSFTVSLTCTHPNYIHTHYTNEFNLGTNFADYTVNYTRLQFFRRNPYFFGLNNSKISTKNSSHWKYVLLWHPYIIPFTSWQDVVCIYEILTTCWKSMLCCQLMLFLLTHWFGSNTFEIKYTFHKQKQALKITDNKVNSLAKESIHKVNDPICRHTIASQHVGTYGLFLV